MLYIALVPAFYSERYSLALAPFYLTGTGIAVASPWLLRRLTINSVPVPWVLAGVLFVFSIVTSVLAQRATFDSIPREVIPAARTLRLSARPDARVMALKSHIAYYSGLDFAPIGASPSRGCFPAT